MTCTMVMINNSTLPGTRGTINGVSQSMVAILRAIGPTVGANLFYWSELNTDNGENWVTNQWEVVVHAFVLCQVPIDVCNL